MALKIPTVLAFERKINPSDGFLYGTDWDDREKSIPLKLVEKSIVKKRIKRQFILNYH